MYSSDMLLYEWMNLILLFEKIFNLKEFWNMLFIFNILFFMLNIFKYYRDNVFYELLFYIEYY